jgi:hypothetical protein
MRGAFGRLALLGFALGGLACREAPEPCGPGDFAAGTCLETPGGAERLPEGQLVPEWARPLCRQWRRPDGSCDQRQLIAEYGECLQTKGNPAMEALREREVGNRAVYMTGRRHTNTCLELRGWVITEEGLVRFLERRPKVPRAS